ncbi:MAG: NAD(P)(+) transhydrogenase (Re/Si-specific) subunit beta [Candidatus Omnitrophica bacterium]|nr:NAD(P)(+) transhydrogenase (Re/Si-specific) subunit beta [Candidatus Omnitrophota bacterium]
MKFFLIESCYIISASLFIFGLKLMNRVKMARLGDFLAAIGMLIAIVITLILPNVINYKWIFIAVLIGSIIGIVWARVVPMTAMPQMVGMFNGFGGLASALVSCSEYLRAGESMTTFTLTIVMLGTFVGAVTFTGSTLAYGKLEGFVEQRPVVYPLQKTINLLLSLASLGCGVVVILNPNEIISYWVVMALSSILGVLLVLPIGGADMPVVISLLNSYSGIAGMLTGFVLMNDGLIVAGTLVGASGIILTKIMCKAMNRSLANVMFGTFGKIDEAQAKGQSKEYVGVKSCTAEEVAIILENATQVIIVPGYGLAASHAQHAIGELAKILEDRGTKVKYAIHPVAGRMPGHMNILLAEASVPYDRLYEMDVINPEFEQTDVALVIGANDVTNPSARNQPGSPIYGMPILNVDKAKSIVVIKRSLSPGFAGIKNPLFENEKTVMFFDDGRAAVEQITKEVKNL